MLDLDTGKGRCTTTGTETKAMSSTPMIRADAYGLLPTLLIVLMLILAALGVVAHAAAL